MKGRIINSYSVTCAREGCEQTFHIEQVTYSFTERTLLRMGWKKPDHTWYCPEHKEGSHDS